MDPAKPHMVTVAVKSFQSQLRERNHSFLQDLAIMVASRYQNVAQLYGVVHERKLITPVIRKPINSLDTADCFCIIMNDISVYYYVTLLLYIICLCR